MANNVKLQKALLATVAAGALTFGFGMNSAFALPSVSSQLFYGSTNQISDDDAETLIENGTPNGLIDIGDVLSGVILWNTNAQTSGGSGVGAFGNTNNEFSGVFQAVVLDRTFLSAQGTGAADDIYGFTFGPTSGFEA